MLLYCILICWINIISFGFYIIYLCFFCFKMDEKVSEEEQFTETKDDPNLRNFLEPLNLHGTIYDKLLGKSISLDDLKVIKSKDLIDLANDMMLKENDKNKFIKLVRERQNLVIQRMNDNDPKKRHNSKNYDYLVKLLIIGDSGTGKSSLLLRWVDDMFTDKFITTVGIDFKHKIVDTGLEIVKCQIWDTAGQERFRTIMNAFYRGAMGVLICYDITDLNSFNNISTWISDVENNCNENTIKFIVGLKNDLNHERKIKFDDAQKVADKYGCYFIECSAKINSNVDQLFRVMVSYVVYYHKARRDQPGNNIKLDNNSSNNKHKSKCC